MEAGQGQEWSGEVGMTGEMMGIPGFLAQGTPDSLGVLE